MKNKTTRQISLAVAETETGVNVEAALELLEDDLNDTALLLLSSDDKAVMESIVVVLANARAEVRSILDGDRPYGYSIKGFEAASGAG